ncbi:hypothetical protein Srubr_81610 [Streptomyces rubradiris]|uniref:Uncharacterized protein n=1 Tax=Streptomyces rubradiris TaxID=285531 RepID=A0ABQ3RR26_STRRR|nr:hypothetical protein [Streptomyces rubradiris]GHI58315.1 hypothetical protein Srubr_81610 [Streptomyces rubradiris]
MKRPKTWRASSLASGATGIDVRSASAPTRPAWHIELTDPAGQRVLEVAELVTEQREQAQPAASCAGLFRIDWVDHPLPPNSSAAGSAARYITDATDLVGAPATC